MRFIVILVLFSLIACAMCDESFIFKPFTEAKDGKATEELQIPLGGKAACTIGWCIDVCLSVMSPPFTAQCSGNYCICRKL